jgi:hypothetical protein
MVMATEEAVLAKLRCLPDHERARVLSEVAKLVDEHIAAWNAVQRGVAAVKSTWASIPVDLDDDTVRWLAEDKELEYETG